MIFDTSALWTGCGKNFQKVPISHIPWELCCFRKNFKLSELIIISDIRPAHWAKHSRDYTFNLIVPIIKHASLALTEYF